LVVFSALVNKPACCSVDIQKTKQENTMFTITHTLADHGTISDADAYAPERDVLQIVNALEPSELSSYAPFLPHSLQHYAQVQRKWMQDCIYFLGIDLGRQPQPGEIADKILNSDHSKRFRAFYALQFPDKVYFDEATYEHQHKELHECSEEIFRKAFKTPCNNPRFMVA
jgi:hypothetical protein